MVTKNLSRQQARTRLALMNAAIQLILENGYDKLTIKAVTDRADYGQRVFYLHFDDKADILYDIITHWLNRTTEDIFATVKHYPSPEREYRAFRMIIQSLIKNRSFMTQATTGISSQLSSRLRDFIASDVKKHIEAGHLTLHDGMNPETVSQFHAGMMNEVFRSIIRGGNSVDADEIADNLFRFTFRNDPPDINN